ncbi:MAG: class I SAM-dependent methyltransferase [Proteobacteria bacterium]|nr:class I SAM-dependent methyltransferase [Pseudomonadota bacterium]MDA1308404.1 class I SAM-dependent methyltransferase [Pseudomonadota bacterium]
MKGQFLDNQKHRFSRENPTPHYRKLIEFYQQLHHTGGLFQGHQGADDVVSIPPENMFEGGGLLDFALPIKTISQRNGARSILDYGSGKGLQYDKGRAMLDGQPVDVRDYWGVDQIHVFDPGLSEKATPVTADGVISTDVLEHCFHADIPWIIEEMFALAGKFVWCNIDCFSARKLLPNGENVHITVREPAYWQGVFEATGNRYRSIDWEIGCRHLDKSPTDQGPVMTYYRRPEVEAEINEQTRFAR